MTDATDTFPAASDADAEGLARPDELAELRGEVRQLQGAMTALYHQSDAQVLVIRDLLEVATSSSALLDKIFFCVEPMIRERAATLPQARA